MFCAWLLDFKTKMSKMFNMKVNLDENHIPLNYKPFDYW